MLGAALAPIVDRIPERDIEAAAALLNFIVT
jgi:hypothetical protein